MSDETKPPEETEEKADEEPLADDEGALAMRDLLKRSLGTPGNEVPKKPDLLRGVQRRIRQRSKGKFFSDGWSTSQSKVNYALVAVLMLLVIAVCYFALGPTGISAH